MVLTMICVLQRAYEVQCSCCAQQTAFYTSFPEDSLAFVRSSFYRFFLPLNRENAEDVWVH